MRELALPWLSQPQEPVGANRDWNLTHLWGQNTAGRMRLRDSAGNADGTFAVAPSGSEPSGVRWVVGPEGYYLLLDNAGTGDFNSIVTTLGDANGSAALGPTFSVAGRIRPGGTGGVIIGGPTGSYNLRLNTGKLELSWSGLADLGQGSTALSAGVDYDFGASFNGTSLRFYLNGRPDGTATTSASPTLQQTYLGARAPGVEMLDSGTRVYWLATSNREWTPAQFASLAGQGWLQLWEPQRIWVPVSAGGGGGVTGTLATTNASDSLAAAGTTTVAGTLARTNANDTLVAAGTTTVTGSLAKINANDSLAASGDVGGAVTGTLNRQNANDTLAAAGTTAVVGTVAAANAPDTLSAAGSTTVAGTLAKANGNDTLQATGAAGSVTGSVAVTNRNDTLEAYGTSGAGTVIGKGFEMGGRAAREVSIKPLLRRILDERAARAEEAAAPEVKLATKEKRQRARLLEKVAARVAIADEPNAEQRFLALMQQWTQLEPAIQPGALGAAVDQYTAFMSRVADQVARIQQQDEEEAVLVLLLSL